MYPSDEYMVYANDVNTGCYNTPFNQFKCSVSNAQKGWVYIGNKLSTESSPNYTWFLSPYEGTSNFALEVIASGYLGGIDGNIFSYGVRPVVYLSSDVQIFDGDGSEGNPYKLKK